jgi:uncharacterized protein YfaS (alpha-2-macroglobulin family)
MRGFLFIFCLICSRCLLAQVNEGQSFLLENQLKPQVLEKIYLHTDRSFFTGNDDIWFKAYLVEAQTNILTNHSNNLTVELISPNGKVKMKRMVCVSNGVGTGIYKLDEKLR